MWEKVTCRCGGRCRQLIVDPRVVPWNSTFICNFVLISFLLVKENSYLCLKNIINFS